jgi:hypothetical protein
MALRRSQRAVCLSSMTSIDLKGSSMRNLPELNLCYGGSV